MSIPFYSVIVPTYNRANFIGETIESILAQTFQDFELIIVDDGSSDNTKEVINLFVSDPRVRYIYQENKERAAARNNGIRNSKGEWIALLDSDDLWLPNHLEVGCNTIQKHKQPALIYSWPYQCDDKGKILYKMKSYRFEGFVFEKLIIQGYKGVPLSVSSCFFNRAILDDIGLFNEDRLLSGSEDKEFWFRISSKYPLFSTQAYTVKSRKHPQQSIRNTDSMEKSMLRMHELLFSNLALININHLKRISLANVYVLIAINYYASGRMKEARKRLHLAIKVNKRVLINPLYLWTLLRTLLPKQVTFKLREIKYRFF